MNVRPTNLQLVDQEHLLIEFNDGQRRRYRISQLREACPCATCRERRAAPSPPPTELTVLSAGEAQPQRITSMQPVGGYAYSIHFSDGHDTGIYTFDHLLELGEPVE